MIKMFVRWFKNLKTFIRWCRSLKISEDGSAISRILDVLKAKKVWNDLSSKATNDALEISGFSEGAPVISNLLYKVNL